MGAGKSSILEPLKESLPLKGLRDLAEHKSVPVHSRTVFYYLGGMTLFFFVVQIVTGMLLMLYYRPSASEAFESVEFIMTTVPFGWLIRSIHSWSANLLVYFAFVHLATVYFVRAYRHPRQVTWMSGTLLLFVAMAFGFSGYLLPWNKLAFFATKVGTDIAGAVPLVGESILRFLRGGERVTGGTLSRFYGWHVAILPLITTFLLGLHVILVQVHGMSVPPDVERKGGQIPSMKFIPHFALRDLFGWTVALGVLAALAALFPWELGEKADAFAPAYKNIRPEWYFMFMFQTLKLIPGGQVLGIEYEAIPILLFGAGGAILLLAPLIDRRTPAPGSDRIHTAIGVITLMYIVGMTAWGYQSLVPVYVVLITIALIFGLAVGTRARKEGGS